MQRFPFAILVTTRDNLPVATHLPFLITETDGHLSLTSHMARANPQWKDIDSLPAMVIFSEPHAYISPQHYESAMNVPTWNYIAVHAYGRVSLLHDPEEVMAVLQRTIDEFEGSYRPQWESLPDTYKSSMAKGIVAFRMEVGEIHAKEKLSQNKTPQERARIIASLSDSDHTPERLIAEYMEKKSRMDIQ